MTFLEPFLLAVILPFVVLPIIIHLINRMRYTPMDWAAMNFLFKAKRSSTKFAKLREIIILACRCLAILCLALALSRPLSGGWLGWAFSGSSETVIILLDRSSSMATLDESGQRNKLEKSIAMIKDSAKNLSQGTEYVLIDSATGKARSISSLDALDDSLLFGVTDTGTNMKNMLEAAYEYIKANNPGNSEIWMTGDLQQSNWQPTDEGWDTLKVDYKKLNFKLKFRLLALSHQPKNNVGITVTNQTRYVENGKNFLDFSVRLTRDNIKDAEIQVKLNLNGVEKVRILSMSQESLEYTQTIELGSDDKGGYGVVSIPQDRHPGDNQYYFAYGALLNLKTAVISKSKYSKLLALAAAPIKGLNMGSVIIDGSQLPANLSDSSLVIVENSKITLKQEEQLMKFVEKGGQVLVFPPLSKGSKLLKFIQPGVIETAKKDKTFMIGNWDEQQGPLANSKQGEVLPVNKLYVTSRQLSSLPGEVLASYKDGQSFLSRYGHGKGAVYYCSSSLEPKWSELYKGAILLPMVKRILNEGSKQYSSIVNESCRYDDEINSLEPVVGNKNSAFKSLAAGVYAQKNRVIMLNRPALENDFTLINEEKLNDLFDGLDFSMFNETADGSEETLQSELFSLFALFIIIFLAIEGFLTMRKPIHEVERKA